MGCDVINGCKIDDDFIRAYETKRASIIDYEYGSMYKVIIEINEEGLKAGIIEDLAENEETISVDGSTVTIIWKIPWVDEGVHEIEIELFYTLDAGRYGDYEWECLKTTW